MAEIELTYEIEDGYCGKSRPQHMSVDSEDFEDMTDEQMYNYLEELVLEDMQQRISPAYESSDIISEIKEVLAKEERLAKEDEEKEIG